MPVLGKTKHAVVSEFRCAEILEAARKVFARKGFAAATVDEIAEAAGVAKGTVYLYFKSKREIYMHALRQGISGLIEQTAREMDASPDPTGKLRAFIYTRLRHAEANRDFVRIYHSEFGNMVHPVCLGKDFRSLYQQQLRTLEEVLEQAAACGQIRPLKTDTAAVAIYETTRGFVTRRLLGWSQATVEEDLDFLFELIWKGVAPEKGVTPEQARAPHK